MRRVTLAAGILAAVVILLTFLFVPATPQDARYHDFADQRTLLGIPNMVNVLSNVGFFAVGTFGLVTRRRRSTVTTTFFAAMLATGVGSSLYHLTPNDTTLVYDRLPMTIAFMSFLLILLEHESTRALIALSAAGVASIAWWIAFDDLRPYAIVQAFPILAFFVTRFFPRAHRDAKLWLVTAGYIVAKLCETYDRQIFAVLGGTISGHSLKHLVAAAATLAVWWQLYDERWSSAPPAFDGKSPARLITT
jgi:hypothetical protein